MNGCIVKKEVFQKFIHIQLVYSPVSCICVNKLKCLGFFAMNLSKTNVFHKEY